MHGNQLIFSRSGDRRRLFGVSPFFFNRYTIFNGYWLPEEHEVPGHGLTTRWFPFDFGFNDPTLAIAPFDTAYFSLQPNENFLAESITGVSDVLGVTTTPAAGALSSLQVTPSYLINFQHTHAGNGITRQWASKAITDLEAVGTGERPLLFKSPPLIPKGDTLTCIVQNMANAMLRVQILLAGGSFE